MTPGPEADPLSDALDVGLIVTGPDGRILAWNAWMASASGIAPEAAVSKLLAEVFPTATIERLQAAVRDAFAAGSSSLLTYALHRDLLPLRTRTGRTLIHNIAVRPIGEKPYGRCVIQVSDVTVTAERERVLRKRQNARYDAVVESARDPILTFDGGGLVQFANPAAEREFGYAPAELIGHPIDRLINNRDVWGSAWNAVLVDEAIHWPLELIVRRKDGSDSHVDASASKWLSDARTFVTVIFRDVNERRAAEAELRDLNETLEERVRERALELEHAHEQLRQSQKMEAVGQLTGGIAHDFNNLLTPIVGGLDILQRRGMTDERGRRLLDGALQSAERARMLVQRLLAFARRQPLQALPVDVATVVRDMSDLVGSTLGPRIRMVLDLDEPLAPALADPNQLEMALLNLAVNARDAMPDGGVLTIAARAAEVGTSSKLKAGHYVRLAVTDTGVGMDAETLARAVEPFFSTKGIGKGTGLGLSMIHGLAAQLGGVLELWSTPGVGTTIEMWIPVASGQATAAIAVEDYADLQPGVGTVLLVDDEDLIRASTAQMLTDLGYTVIETPSAQVGMQHLNDPRLRLVVTDHLMPGMTGMEFAREVQAKFPNLPILVISGYAELDDIAPDLPRLMKPFRQAELATALAAANQSAGRRS
jgi:PAS domain S-box-containing protein